jgi:hypothetical protein
MGCRSPWELAQQHGARGAALPEACAPTGVARPLRLDASAEDVAEAVGALPRLLGRVRVRAIFVVDDAEGAGAGANASASASAI